MANVTIECHRSAQTHPAIGVAIGKSAIVDGFLAGQPRNGQHCTSEIAREVNCAHSHYLLIYGHLQNIVTPRWNSSSKSYSKSLRRFGKKNLKNLSKLLFVFTHRWAIIIRWDEVQSGRRGGSDYAALRRRLESPILPKPGVSAIRGAFARFGLSRTYDSPCKIAILLLSETPDGRQAGRCGEDAFRSSQACRTARPTRAASSEFMVVATGT